MSKEAMKLAPEAALRQAVEAMPSNTRYTVEVEGCARTYWDNIHDAITNAQRAVYAGPNDTTRAIDDLKAGRFAEWSYGFSAVRIYPPQKTAPPPARQPLTDERVWLEYMQLWPFRPNEEPRLAKDILRFARAIEAAHGIGEKK